jgi:hypothetical protein
MKVLLLSAFLCCLTVPTLAGAAPQHWEITVRHLDTRYGQGEHYLLIFKGSAPDSDSCYRAIMLDTNYGPVKVETPAKWGDFGFGCADAASMLETSITVEDAGEENTGAAEAGRPKDLIIYKATAQTVNREMVDITKDLVEESFHPLQIKIQARSR